jgi:hypothetical protein
VSDNWISVEERLPTAWITVLLCAVEDDGTQLVGAGFMRTPGGWTAFPFHHGLLVTHWQPLPAPPKREGEK